MRNGSEDKLTSSRRKRSSVIQSTFSGRTLTMFLLFFNVLGILETFALCFQLQVSFIGFQFLKTEHDGLTTC